LMQIKDRIVVSGSREPLAGMGGRVVHVINAALRIREEIPIISAFASCCYGGPAYPTALALAEAFKSL